MQIREMSRVNLWSWCTHVNLTGSLSQGWGCTVFFTVLPLIFVITITYNLVLSYIMLILWESGRGFKLLTDLSEVCFGIYCIFLCAKLCFASLAWSYGVVTRQILYPVNSYCALPVEPSSEIELSRTIVPIREPHCAPVSPKCVAHYCLLRFHCDNLQGAFVVPHFFCALLLSSRR